MKAIVILVEPEYEENLGLITRAMKNFGLKDLVLVNPKIDHLTGKTRSRSVHAQEILEKAKIVKKLGDALKLADYSAATSAKITKSNTMFRNALPVQEFSRRFANSDATIALVFGRESSGLDNKEIQQCDFLVHIPTSREYKSLNISHAAAVLFSQIYFAKKKINFKIASKLTKKIMLRKFKEMIEKRTNIDNKKAVLDSFKGLINRALITEKEARALLSAFFGVKK